MNIPDRSSTVLRLAVDAGLGQGETPEARTAKAAMFTRRVAATLCAEDPRWGLLEKTGGNTHEGYSVDRLAYLDMAEALAWLVDIVVASDGPDARAGWGLDAEPVSSARWRRPPEAIPLPPPDPPSDPVVQCLYTAPNLRPLTEALEALTARVASLERVVSMIEVNVPPVRFPVYEGTISLPFFGTKTITLRPKP
jgi:hypothetical protein